MRVMLLGDLPPCRNLTAGLVLEQLLPCFDSHDLSAALVIDSTLDPQPPNLIPADKTLRLIKPREHRREYRYVPHALGNFAARRFEASQARLVRGELLPRIVSFARASGVEKVWVTLQGQTVVRLARPVADALNVPLHAQIWDPFGWWLRAKRIDEKTSRDLLREFDRVIRRCDGVAAASWSMAERYRTKYGVRAIPVIPGISDDMGRQPLATPHASQDFIIGMAGQLYAIEEWNRLLEALRILNWRVGDQRIRLRVFGNNFEMHTPERVLCEFMGWRDQSEVVQLLAESDLNFIPYWFDPAFKEEAENSFPSKMSTYCAAAKPILAHAPAYATPTLFVEQHDIGYTATRPDAADLADVIRRAAADPDGRLQKSFRAVKCFTDFLTTTCMRRSFRDFLRLP
jgi:glycosyltransferase involved in cell wall biosynthesis